MKIKPTKWWKSTIGKNWTLWNFRLYSVCSIMSLCTLSICLSCMRNVPVHYIICDLAKQQYACICTCNAHAQILHGRQWSVLIVIIIWGLNVQSIVFGLDIIDKVLLSSRWTCRLNKYIHVHACTLNIILTQIQAYIVLHHRIWHNHRL